MINDEISVPESQFQDLNEVVDRNDDTGVMQVESLCMNCHDNVCFSLACCTLSANIYQVLMTFVLAGNDQTFAIARSLLPRYYP